MSDFDDRDEWAFSCDDIDFEVSDSDILTEQLILVTDQESGDRVFGASADLCRARRVGGVSWVGERASTSCQALRSTFVDHSARQLGAGRPSEAMQVDYSVSYLFLLNGQLSSLSSQPT